MAASRPADGYSIRSEPRSGKVRLARYAVGDGIQVDADLPEPDRGRDILGRVPDPTIAAGPGGKTSRGLLLDLGHGATNLVHPRPPEAGERLPILAVTFRSVLAAAFPLVVESRRLGFDLGLPPGQGVVRLRDGATATVLQLRQLALGRLLELHQRGFARFFKLAGADGVGSFGLAHLARPLLRDLAHAPLVDLVAPRPGDRDEGLGLGDRLPKRGLEFPETPSSHPVEPESEGQAEGDGGHRAGDQAVLNAEEVDGRDHEQEPWQEEQPDDAPARQASRDLERLDRDEGLVGPRDRPAEDLQRIVRRLEVHHRFGPRRRVILAIRREGRLGVHLQLFEARDLGGEVLAELLVALGLPLGIRLEEGGRFPADLIESGVGLLLLRAGSRDDGPPGRLIMVLHALGVDLEAPDRRGAGRQVRRSSLGSLASPASLATLGALPEAGFRRVHSLREATLGLFLEPRPLIGQPSHEPRDLGRQTMPGDLRQGVGRCRGAVGTGPRGLRQGGRSVG
jgi:hypothetical protein